MITDFSQNSQNNSSTKNNYYSHYDYDLGYDDNQKYDDHIKEWELSAIAPDLIESNLVSLSGIDALNRLLMSNDLPRLNSGKLSDTITNRYAHCDRGWYCRSYDPVTGDEMEWIQFKPDTPKKYDEYSFSDRAKKEKIIKYESSPKMTARIILPFVPLKRWIEISNKYGCPIDFSKYDNFWQWVIDNPQLPITITEGSKKVLSLLSQNIIAVGVPGVTMGIRKIDNTLKQLHPDLMPFAVKGREFTIAFDSDIKPKTIKNVAKAIFSLAVLLSKNGSKVFIAQWSHQLGKGVDDVLFHSDDKKAVLRQILANAITFDYWTCKYLFALRKADITFNSRWFGDGLSIIPNEKLVCFKSAQFTGKTEIMVNHIQKLISQGQPVFVITHRESLARALAKRFGIAYRTENDPLKGFIGYSLCIDSLLPKKDGFNVEDWEDVTLIVDEVEQVLFHLFNGNTSVSEYRCTIFKTLIELAPKVTQCIIADADLSDVSIDFFEGLLDCKGYLVENKFTFSGMSFIKMPTANNAIGQVIKMVKEQKKLFIVTSAQKAKSKYGTIAIESLVRKYNPTARILRVDAETTGYPDSDSQGCLERMTEIVRNYDVVICSPSIETGISINVEGYFDGVIGINTGNLTPQSFLQFLWRLRDIAATRYYYCNKIGNNYIGNSSQSPKKLLESSQASAKVILKSIGVLDSELDIDGISKLFMDTWAKIGARQNASNRILCELFEDLIKQQGHNLTLDQDDLATIDPKTIKANKEECQSDRNERIESARELSPIEYESLSKKKSRTLDDICSLRQYEIKKRYGQCTQETLLLDDDGFYPQLKLYYYLAVGREFLEDRDKRQIKKLSENNGNQLFSPDIVKSSYSHKVKALELLGINQLLTELIYEGTLNTKDDRIIALWDKCNGLRKDLKSYLGITVPKSPIALFKAIIKLIGFKLGDRTQVKRDGVVSYDYHVKELPDIAYEIIQYWYETDIKLKENNIVDCDTTVVINFPYINIGEAENIKTDDNIGKESIKHNIPNNDFCPSVNFAEVTAIADKFNLADNLPNSELKQGQRALLPNIEGHFTILGFFCNCVAMVKLGIDLLTINSIADIGFYDERSIIINSV